MKQSLSPVYLQDGNDGGSPYAVHPGSIQLHPQVHPQAHYQHNQPVVIVQPSANMRHHPPAKPVPDYMGYSIFTMLCCCICLGCCALQFSRATRTANAAGQRKEAASNSQTALILNHVALVVGIILAGAYLINQLYFSDKMHNP